MRKEISTIETSVGTLARGLDILGLFARGTPELSQSEISAALGLPMPTVHRLTAVLAERGLLERDARTRRYRLGLELARLMPPLLAGLELPDLARPELALLAHETGETVNLAVLQGGETVYLLSESGDRLLTAQAPVGSRLPAHCTALGKCLLAQLPDELARDAAGPEPYQQRTPLTRTTWAELRKSLEQVRRIGVSQSWQEYEIGLAAVAIPLHGVRGGSGAGINVSLPTTRATRTFRTELVGRLRATARRIEASLAATDGH
jgi:IclR family acetate operon transcriptional repressor